MQSHSYHSTNSLSQNHSSASSGYGMQYAAGMGQATASGIPAVRIKHKPYGDNVETPASTHRPKQSLGIRLLLCVMLAAQVLLLSPLMAGILPFQLNLPYANWVSLALSTLLFVYGGMPFLRGAPREISARRPAMHTLGALGITLTYGYSLYAFIMTYYITPDTPVRDFFGELALLVTLLLLGYWVAAQAAAGPTNILKKMRSTLPTYAQVQRPDGSFVSIPLNQVMAGQVVLVSPKERVSVDGIVLEGHGNVLEAPVTGNPHPIAKSVGDEVIAGSKNGAATLWVHVTAAGEDCYVSQMTQHAASPPHRRSAAEVLAGRIGQVLFFVALGVALISFGIWYYLNPALDAAIARTIAVVMVACPQALSLTIPLAMTRAATLGAQNGILIRNRRALERAAHTKVVMLDKTGVLTQGHYRVGRVVSLNRHYSGDTLLQIMAGLEAGSTHPIALGIHDELANRNLPPAPVLHLETIPGYGIAGILSSGEAVRLVSATYLNKYHIAYNQTRYTQYAQRGYSISYLLLDDAPIGFVALADELAPGADIGIQRLRKMGITTIMLTGDSEPPARMVAFQAGVERFRPNLLPGDKEKLVQEQRAKGHTVMTVSNSALGAPCPSDVTVSVGTGAATLSSSADISFAKSTPEDIAKLIFLARKTNRKTAQNTWWGLVYNMVSIPVAAGVFAAWGVLPTPAMAAVVGTLVGLCAIGNALGVKLK